MIFISLFFELILLGLPFLTVRTGNLTIDEIAFYFLYKTYWR